MDPLVRLSIQLGPADCTLCGVRRRNTADVACRGSFVAAVACGASCVAPVGRRVARPCLVLSAAAPVRCDKPAWDSLIMPLTVGDLTCPSDNTDISGSLMMTWGRVRPSGPWSTISWGSSTRTSAPWTCQPGPGSFGLAPARPTLP